MDNGDSSESPEVKVSSNSPSGRLPPSRAQLLLLVNKECYWRRNFIDQRITEANDDAAIA